MLNKFDSNWLFNYYKLLHPELFHYINVSLYSIVLDYNLWIGAT